MWSFIPVEERESRCYDWFRDYNIESRDALRDKWKTNPIDGVRVKFVEEMFSDYQDRKRLFEKRRDERLLNNHLKQTFVLSDIHIPFHDEKTLAPVIDCLADFQPKNLVFCGDVLDCYSISRFSKRPDRVKSLQDEINIFYNLMKEIKKAVPYTDIHYILGNHENRLEKLILDNPGLFGLKALEPQKLFRLDELGIKYYKTKVNLDGFIYYHGDVVRKNAGYSAKAEYEDHKMNDGVSGHCFSEDVEILTPTGWKCVIDTNIGETVGTINKETKAFEWNVVRDKFVYDTYKELYHIKSPVVDLMVTDKHGLVGYNKNTDKFEEFTAAELAMSNKIYKFICAAEHNSEKGLEISEAFLRLLVNISADGCIEDNSFRFHLKKKRKIDHLRAILDTLGLDYTVRSQKIGTTKIRISTECSKPIINEYFKNGKQLPEILRSVNTEQAHIILDEYARTDGNKNLDSKNSYQISTKKLEEADLLQEIFSKHGIRSSKISRYGSYYVISANIRSLTYIGAHNVSIVPYDGRVSCVSVDNGTLVVRSKGKTVITQNTHRLSSYYSTYERKPGQWFENGCLCKLEPDYLNDPDKANWQQGFTVIDNYDDINQGSQVLIRDHKFSYGGRVYK